MKKILFFALALCFAMGMYAQTDKPAEEPLPKVYDESINAMQQIDMALERARAENKQVLLQVGGNWCPWCLRFAQFVETNEAVHEVVEKYYVYVHLNTSKKNKNMEALKRLENPGRFGYPVFVILDQEGCRLHTQNSSYLEEGKGYNEKKVVDFLMNWTPEAIKEIK